MNSSDAAKKAKLFIKMVECDNRLLCMTKAIRVILTVALIMNTAISAIFMCGAIKNR